jgi:hypothetical protein
MRAAVNPADPPPITAIVFVFVTIGRCNRRRREIPAVLTKAVGYRFCDTAAQKNARYLRVATPRARKSASPNRTTVSVILVRPILKRSAIVLRAILLALYLAQASLNRLLHCFQGHDGTVHGRDPLHIEPKLGNFLIEVESVLLSY